MSNQDFSDVHIETTLPKPWEEEQTFNDVLYDWMGRAPWLGISFIAHLLIYFVLAAIPWDKFKQQEEVVLQASVITPPEEIFEEPEEEEIEEIEEEIVEEPVIQDTEVTEDVEDVQDEVDSDRPESPFDSDAFNDVIGIGGGAGGGGGKIGGRRRGRKAVGRQVEQALTDGLEWLKDHQSENGSWEPRDYAINCDEYVAGTTDEIAWGDGNPVHDVGITGLALLAFLGFGDTMNEGDYAPVIRRGVNWLQEQQQDNGRIGEDNSLESIYNHAIATLALSEAYYGAKNPLLKMDVQKAVNFIVKARAPYGIWDYYSPNGGAQDSSVSGWMLFALASAADADLRVDEAALRDTLAAFDDLTDANGRTGYRNANELSSRKEGLADRYPRETSEALTAVGLLTRVFVSSSLDMELEEVAGPDGQSIELGVRLLAEELPSWPKEYLPTGSTEPLESVSAKDQPGGLDMYYWYYGSYALYQLSEEYPSAWREWESALKTTVLESQHKTPPCFEGSWDPIGPWGEEGGRVYSTALMVLCLEVYFRYGKVLGAR